MPFFSLCRDALLETLSFIQSLAYYTATVEIRLPFSADWFATNFHRIQFPIYHRVFTHFTSTGHVYISFSN